jgi:ubiquinone/menaquinone biosynthesis C-methylase UbiE
MELRAHAWRRELWASVTGHVVLEIGAGTGKSIPFYPRRAKVIATDISDRMLDRARRRADRLGARVKLERADVQQLPYPSESFDTVVGTFVFCSVPDPLLGLREVVRVLRPGGQLLLLEHVLSGRPVLRQLMRWFDPVPFRLWGAHINRDTLSTVQAAGFEEVRSTNLSLDVVRRIEASVARPK